MTTQIYYTPEGQPVVAESSEAEAWGWTPATTVPQTTYTSTGSIIRTNILQPSAQTPSLTTSEAEMQQIAEKGGGVLSEIGKTTDVKPTQAAIERYQLEKLKEEHPESEIYKIGGEFYAYPKVGVGEQAYSTQEGIMIERVRQPQQLTPQQQFQMTLGTAQNIQQNPFTGQYFTMKEMPLTTYQKIQQAQYEVDVKLKNLEIQTANTLQLVKYTTMSAFFGAITSPVPEAVKYIPYGKELLGTAMGSYFTYQAASEYFTGSLTPTKLLLYSIPIGLGYGSVLASGYQREFKQWDIQFEQEVQKGITEDQVKYGLSLLKRTEKYGEPIPRTFGFPKYDITPETTYGIQALEWAKGRPASVPRVDILNVWRQETIDATLYPYIPEIRLTTGQTPSIPTTELKPLTEKEYLFVVTREGKPYGFMVTPEGKIEDRLISPTGEFLLPDKSILNVKTDFSGVIQKVDIKPEFDFYNLLSNQKVGSIKQFSIRYEPMGSPEFIKSIPSYIETIATEYPLESGSQRVDLFAIEIPKTETIHTIIKPQPKDIIEGHKISKVFEDAINRMNAPEVSISDSLKQQVFTEAKIVPITSVPQIEVSIVEAPTELIWNIPPPKPPANIMIPIISTGGLWSQAQTPFQRTVSDVIQTERRKIVPIQISQPTQTQKRFEEMKQIRHPIQEDYTVQLPIQIPITMNLQAPIQAPKQLQQLRLQEQLTELIPIPFQKLEAPKPTEERPRPERPEYPEKYFEIPKTKIGGSLKIKSPSIKFYPRSGKERSKSMIIPRAGLFSLGREMTESITRKGRWKIPQHPKPTKKTRKMFARQLFESFPAIEFPTSKQLSSGRRTTMNVGTPSLDFIMPSFKNRRKRKEWF